MLPPNQINKTNDSLKRSLLSSIECFRTGKDNQGLDAFLDSIDDLRIFIDCYELIAEPVIDKILPSLKKLYICMQSRDIAGMTDLLEFEIYPLIEEWDAEAIGL